MCSLFSSGWPETTFLLTNISRNIHSLRLPDISLNVNNFLALKNSESYTHLEKNCPFSLSNIPLYSIDHYEIILTYSSIQKKKSVKTKQITNFLCIYYAHTTIYVGSFVIWCMMSDVHSWIIDINSPVSVAQRSVYFPTDFSTPGRCQGPGRRARPRSSPSPPSPGWTQAPCWPCPWQPPSWAPSSTIIW